MSQELPAVIVPIAAGQLPSVIALIAAAKLPTSDITPDRVVFFGAFEGDRLVGTIGLERVDGAGLLRSLAVEPDRRARGIARALYERLLAEASQAGLTDLYCLTTTADGFFTHLGFGSVPRTEAPQGIQATPEFSSLCPSSTRLYTRSLDQTACYFSSDALTLRESAAGARHFAVSLAATTLSYFEVDPGARFDRHRHDGEQITLVLEGELHFRFDDRQVCVRAGETIAIPAGLWHEVWAGAMLVKAVDAWSPARRDLSHPGPAPMSNCCRPEKPTAR
jgi:amino-acid N-acetyltransferase